VAIVIGLLTLAHIFARQAPGELFGLPGLKQTLDRAGIFVISLTMIIATFALLLGFVNVVTVHWSRIHSGKAGSLYSVVLLGSLAATLLLGSGGPSAGPTQFIFQFILQPLEATFFALLALFIATAAFRAFRVRNLEMFLFVLFALIVLLGQVPISLFLWSELPLIKDWILMVPTLAGVRGILLGVALGTIATGLRLILGTDRPYADV
jgi:hypothetical protein